MAKWNLDKITNVSQKGKPMAKYTRSEILDTAKEYTTKDRAADHGNMEDNFKTIGDLFSTFLGIDVSPTQAGILMCLVKIARQKSNPNHADNYIDLAGYAACSGELSAKRPEPKPIPPYEGGNT